MNILYKNGDPLFHPSQFETTTFSPNVPEDKRTLLTIQNERSLRLPNFNIQQLKSPGAWKLSENDDDLSNSNTRHLYKALYGETLLTFLFFSKQNIQSIQNVIKFLVNKETGYVVDNQSNQELLVIMRSIFLEYSSHPQLIDEKMTDEEKEKLLVLYKNEVQRLNEIVINAVVPKIVSQLQQYLDYLRDASSQPFKTDNPENVNISGERQYRSVTQVLIGGQL